jgi:cell division protein ZapE
VSGKIKHAYDSLVSSGAVSEDTAQQALCARYDALLSELNAYNLHQKSWSNWLLRRTSSVPRGIYSHGQVGRGKTMLMNLFFEKVTHISKHRIHFHGFMQHIHGLIHEHRQKNNSGDEDPIPPIAKALAKRHSLLCFDEFYVSDITDAMIISRLFKALFDEGLILVATSNSAPDELYKNGLNRHYFEPFISVLKAHCEIWNLDARTDFRREKLLGYIAYHTPLTAQTDKAMDDAFARFLSQELDQKTAYPTTLKVRGHDFFIPLASTHVARFGFEDLCGKPYSAADYIALAQKFKTIFIDHVPQLNAAKANEAKRFTLLIDVLYESRTVVFLSAACSLDTLYDIKKTEHEFARTSSRLFEMTSLEWQENI